MGHFHDDYRVHVSESAETDYADDDSMKPPRSGGKSHATVATNIAAEEMTTIRS
ncbi:MAG: hypothetical protein ACLSFT_05080 [Ruminococcus callidus]